MARALYYTFETYKKLMLIGFRAMQEIPMFYCTCRDIPLTLARAFGKSFRPASPIVEDIWETIWTKDILIFPDKV